MNSRKKAIGWIFFVAAIGFFLLQMNYFFLQSKLLIEYSDNRLFYVINIFVGIFISLSFWMLLPIKKKGRILSSSVFLLFIIFNGILLFKHPINQFIRVSPDFKHVFIIKDNREEAHYYRTYYGIFARQKDTLPYPMNGEYKIDWLTNDVAAMTYKAKDNSIHQYVGTYGDRGRGGSYYYVGSAIYGEWKGGNSKISSHTDGITVEHEGNSATFTWDQVIQFGTLAVVLVENNEAKWTVALNDDFKMDPSTGIGVTGTISLYKASMGDVEIITLQR
ncbi:hypothetical protein RGU12_01420 [Fredinandcohnia sp. QZ13]|uniref:hypothetical protein n=1 Tax=Fredinandcohnia sp. QZ13 TaxID=3073144 RepID=UPI0028534891|nr:hypothetical protein [Fredinandcohnia sp. QZ13]MDR4886204.1 hypothetical protein [Fredinandcohnia sp. QZ13]